MGEGRRNEKNSHTYTHTPTIPRWIETNEFNILFGDSLTFVSICRGTCVRACTGARAKCAYLCIRDFVFIWHIEQIDVTKMLFRQNEIGNLFLMPFRTHIHTTTDFTFAILVHCLKNLISGAREREMLSQFVLSLEKISCRSITRANNNSKKKSCDRN